MDIPLFAYFIALYSVVLLITIGTNESHEKSLKSSNNINRNRQ